MYVLNFPFAELFYACLTLALRRSFWFLEKCSSDLLLNFLITNTISPEISLIDDDDIHSSRVSGSFMFACFFWFRGQWPFVMIHFYFSWSGYGVGGAATYLDQIPLKPWSGTVNLERPSVGPLWPSEWCCKCSVRTIFTTGTRSRCCNQSYHAGK